LTSTLERTDTDAYDKPQPAHPALGLALAEVMKDLELDELTERYQITERRLRLSYGAFLPPGCHFTLNDCLTMEALFAELLHCRGRGTPGWLLKRLFLEEVTRDGAFPKRVTYVCVNHDGKDASFIDVTYVMMDPPPPPSRSRL